MPKTASRTRRPARSREAATVTPSSGNVFADLGLRDADELLAKADLAHAIQQLIQARGVFRPGGAPPPRGGPNKLLALFPGRGGAPRAHTPPPTQLFVAPALDGPCAGTQK